MSSIQLHAEQLRMHAPVTWALGGRNNVQVGGSSAPHDGHGSSTYSARGCSKLTSPLTRIRGGGGQRCKVQVARNTWVFYGMSAESRGTGLADELSGSGSVTIMRHERQCRQHFVQRESICTFCHTAAMSSHRPRCIAMLAASRAKAQA